MGNTPSVTAVGYITNAMYPEFDGWYEMKKYPGTSYGPYKSLISMRRLYTDTRAEIIVRKFRDHFNIRFQNDDVEYFQYNSQDRQLTKITEHGLTSTTVAENIDLEQILVLHGELDARMANLQHRIVGSPPTPARLNGGPLYQEGLRRWLAMPAEIAAEMKQR